MMSVESTPYGVPPPGISSGLALLPVLSLLNTRGGGSSSHIWILSSAPSCPDVPSRAKARKETALSAHLRLGKVGPVWMGSMGSES